MVKIAERSKDLKLTLDEISLLRKEATKLFYDNQHEEYFEKELTIRDKELFAIFQALMVSRKSKTINDKNFVIELEKDFKAKTELLMESEFLNNHQKLKLFFSNSYFIDDQNMIDSFKKEFAKLDTKTKQSLVIDCIQHYDNLCYSKGYYLDELKLTTIYSYPTKHLEEYRRKHDSKILLALEGSLDYHFNIKPIMQNRVVFGTKLDNMSLKDYIYMFFLSDSKKYLKNEIRNDRNETGKSYEMLLEEKN
jgi:hypothetical protein